MMDNSINTDKIMTSLKQKAKDITIPDFDSVPHKKNPGAVIYKNPDTAIRELRSLSYVHPYRNITGSPPEVFLKKSVRKIIAFCTEPVIAGQNNFNASAEATITSLRNAQKELLRRIEKLEKDLYNEKNNTDTSHDSPR